MFRRKSQSQRARDQRRAEAHRGKLTIGPRRPDSRSYAEVATGATTTVKRSSHHSSTHYSDPLAHPSPSLFPSQEFPSLPPPNVTEGTPFSPVYRAANRSGEPLTTASADTNPVLHATIQHHRETTSDVTEEAPISPGYTAANCSGEPPTTARVDNMHPVLHAMTQHDRATTCDVREETKSRDYTEVANRRESPTTVRAGSTEELPRETRRPEEAVTSDITGETYGSGDQTAANGRGRFPPMAREDRVPVPHTTRTGKDSEDALRRECTSRAGRQTVRTRAGSRSTSAGRGLQQAGIDSYMRGQPANLNAPTNRRTPRVKSNVDK
ncbi:hypothetical protein ACOMHN_065441 [Nucella lapillus]